MANRKGCTSDARYYRNQYLYREYIKLRNTGEFASIDSISRHMAKHLTMPHHFLSEQAGRYLYLNKYRYDKIIAGKYRKPLVVSFLTICAKIKKANPGMANITVVKIASDYPAPCCGLSPSQINRILISFGAH